MLVDRSPARRIGLARRGIGSLFELGPRASPHGGRHAGFVSERTNRLRDAHRDRDFSPLRLL
jgi:hypothetical protein